MLAFVHIPKTAGTTLHKIITHQYPSRRIAIHHDSDGPPDAALAERLACRHTSVVMGHFSIGLHRFIPGLRYITCLRDPVSRIISHYHHTLNTPDHYLHRAVTTAKMDPADYVSSGLSGELSNGMTRMLAGMDDFDHGTVDESTLSLAKSNITNHFDGVVLSESFDAGILMLARSLGWSRPYYIRRKTGRYGTATRTPDAHTRSAIEQYNRLDCELHAWAADRFANEWKNMPDHHQLLRSFQQANRHAGKVIFCLRELKNRTRALIHTQRRSCR
jgi:hypothetical protein